MNNLLEQYQQQSFAASCRQSIDVADNYSLWHKDYYENIPNVFAPGSKSYHTDEGGGGGSSGGGGGSGGSSCLYSIIALILMALFCSFADDIFVWLFKLLFGSVRDDCC